MKSIHLTLIVFLSLSTVQGFACSGENAGDIITRNEDFSRISFIICLLMAIATIAIQTYFKLFRVSFALPVFVILLVIAHPYHWIDANGGDCGMALFEWSIYSSISLLTIFLFTVIKGGMNLSSRAGNQR
jgi:hypothetical protein